LHRVRGAVIGAVFGLAGVVTVASTGDHKSTLRVLASTASQLRVENVRLETWQGQGESLSSKLKFDAVNAGSVPLTNMILEISILEERGDGEPLGIRIKPFQVRRGGPLQAGFTMHFELIFRSLQPDCQCVPNVEVISVDWHP
jgi:hypothetical protein